MVGRERKLVTYLDEMNPECDDRQVETKLSATSQHDKYCCPSCLLFLLQHPSDFCLQIGHFLVIWHIAQFTSLRDRVVVTRHANHLSCVLNQVFLCDVFRGHLMSVGCAWEKHALGVAG